MLEGKWQHLNMKKFAKTGNNFDECKSTYVRPSDDQKFIIEYNNRYSDVKESRRAWKERDQIWVRDDKLWVREIKFQANRASRLMTVDILQIYMLLFYIAMRIFKKTYCRHLWSGI